MGTKITLTGFGFVLVNFLTLLWYNPTLDQDCPTWVYYSWAVGLFLYQTFDAVDGTQAYEYSFHPLLSFSNSILRAPLALSPFVLPFF